MDKDLQKRTLYSQFDLGRGKPPKGESGEDPSKPRGSKQSAILGNLQNYCNTLLLVH